MFRFIPASLRGLLPDLGASGLLRRLIPCAVAVAALALTLQAWNRLVGHGYYQQVQELRAGWYRDAGNPRDRELHQGFKLGYRAVQREPGNADYRFILAGLHSWRQRGLRLWPDQANAETDKVIEGLKATLVRRPSWFEPWIMLALVKFQAGEIDHELRVALEKAMETGQYETVVHHGLAVTATRVLDRLGPELQGKTIETLSIALENPDVRDFVVEQIIASGRTEVFRDRLEADEYLFGQASRYLDKFKESF